MSIGNEISRRYEGPGDDTLTSLLVARSQQETLRCLWFHSGLEVDRWDMGLRELMHCNSCGAEWPHEELLSCQTLPFMGFSKPAWFLLKHYVSDGGSFGR
jgi:hypothetical protein